MRAGVVDGRSPTTAVPAGGAAAWLNRLRLTAWGYERLWRHRSVGILSGGAFSTERELATLCAWTAPLEGRDALDLGCSAGLYARTLAAGGARVHALDASRAFLVEADRLARRDGVEITLVLGDAHALPYRDATFDLVVVGATLNELADPARGLAEVARVLRPDGLAWFMYAVRSGPAGRPLQALLGLGGLRFPRPGDVDAWAVRAGLMPVRGERRGAIQLALYRRDGGGAGAADAAPLREPYPSMP